MQTNSKIKIAIIGLGNAGKQHIKTCIKNDKIDLIGCAIKSENKTHEIEKEYGILCVNDYKKIINLNPEGIIIATPTQTHPEIANFFLNNSINILVEKPVSYNKIDIEKLIELAKNKKKILMPCHDLSKSNGINFLIKYLESCERKQIIKIEILREENERNLILDPEEIYNSLYHLIYLLLNIQNLNISDIQINNFSQAGQNNNLFIELNSKERILAEIGLKKNFNSKNNINIKIQFSDKVLNWNFNFLKEEITIEDLAGNKIPIDTSEEISQKENLIEDFINKIKTNNIDTKEIEQAMKTTEICKNISEKIEEMCKKEKRSIAYLQITRKCNNNCVFCSNPKINKELSLEEIREIVQQYKKDKIDEVFLTGGEPTTHPLLFEIVKIVAEKDIIVRLITNGINLDEKFIKKIENSAINSINLSFHAHIEEVSEKLFGNKDVIAKQKNALKLLNDSKVPFYINTTINSINYKLLPELMKFINNNYNRVNHVVFNFLDPGTSDGIIKNNANKNNWIVAKYSLMEAYLYESLKFLKEKSITFRVERIPLCYLQEFEEYSTETRKNVKKQSYTCAFIRAGGKSEIRKTIGNDVRTKEPVCQKCSYNQICAGIQKEYIDIYGAQELYPIFKDKTKIITKILKNE